MKEKFNVDEIEKYINEKMEKIEYGKMEYEKAEKLSEGEKIMGVYKGYREIEGKFGKNIVLILDSLSIFLPLRVKKFIEEKLVENEKIEIVRGRDEVKTGKKGKYVKSVYYVLRTEGKKIIAYKI